MFWLHVGAFIIRIGFWGFRIKFIFIITTTMNTITDSCYYYDYYSIYNIPPNPILIIKAPILGLRDSGGFYGLGSSLAGAEILVLIIPITMRVCCCHVQLALLLICMQFLLPCLV